MSNTDIPYHLVTVILAVFKQRKPTVVQSEWDF